MGTVGPPRSHVWHPLHPSTVVCPEGTSCRAPQPPFPSRRRPRHPMICGQALNPPRARPAAPPAPLLNPRSWPAEWPKDEVLLVKIRDHDCYKTCTTENPTWAPVMAGDVQMCGVHTRRMYYLGEAHLQLFTHCVCRPSCLGLASSHPPGARLRPSQAWACTAPCNALSPQPTGSHVHFSCTI